MSWSKATSKIADTAEKISDDITDRKRIDDAGLENVRNLNRIDAARGSFYDKGWRPGIGWTALCGIVYAFIMQPLLSWASLNFGWVVPPKLDDNVLWVIVSIATGVAITRSWDKKNKMNLYQIK